MTYVTRLFQKLELLYFWGEEIHTFASREVVAPQVQSPRFARFANNLTRVTRAATKALLLVVVPQIDMRVRGLVQINSVQIEILFEIRLEIMEEVFPPLFDQSEVSFHLVENLGDDLLVLNDF